MPENVIVRAVYPGQSAREVRKQIQAEYPELKLGIEICSWSRSEFEEIGTVDFKAAQKQVDVGRARTLYFVYPDRNLEPNFTTTPRS